MTGMTIHGVKDVRFSKISKNTIKDTGRVYYTRELVVKSRDGEIEIMLFSDNREDLAANKKEE